MRESFNETNKMDNQETRLDSIKPYSEIKPDNGMNIADASQFWDSVFQPKDDNDVGYYSTYKDRFDRTPDDLSKLGKWSEERGESLFCPNENTVEGKAAKAKLAEYKLIGIEYKNAEPDFSKCAVASVEIPHMTENRYVNYYDSNGVLRPGNFAQANEVCAKHWNDQNFCGKDSWTAREVDSWRKENKLTWHECCDTKTMHLVSQDIHGYFIHSGGVAECKIRDNVHSGGGFDE